jgi:hypothetical protein
VARANELVLKIGACRRCPRAAKKERETGLVSRVHRRGKLVSGAALLDQALAGERGRGYSKGFGSNLAQDFACDFTPLPCTKDKGERWLL